MKELEQVGVLVVSTAPLRREGFETAAWFRDHRLVNGTYPVYRREDCNRAGLVVEVDSVIENEYFGTLYGGVQVGEYKPKDIGKPSKYSQAAGFYDYGGERKRVFDDLGDFFLTTDSPVLIGCLHERNRVFTTVVVAPQLDFV